ncbi:MAG: molecular chaperone DnaJ [Desulfovibrio sp.]|nr:MAG: molecular chaperone DnaJ [Desulfovibrio sp.]
MPTLDPLATFRSHLARALRILGLDPQQIQPEENRIKYAFHCQMLAHHPDRNPGNPRAHDFAALLAEARNIALGQAETPYLILQDDVVEAFLQEPVEPLIDAPTYEEWLMERFLDLDGKSIWTY